MIEWFFLALGACLFWGTGYACLKPVNENLSPFMIQICYAIVTGPLNLVAMWVKHKFDKESLPSLTFGASLWFWVLGYSVLVNYGSWCFFSAAKMRSPTSSSIGIVTAVTSIYPLVTCLWTWLYWKEQVQLAFMIPGLLFCILGATLLVFA